MTDVGRAEVQVKGDVRDFARQTEKDLDRALSRIDLDPVKVKVDSEAIRESGEVAGGELADGITRGADGRLRDSRGKFVQMGRDAGKSAGKGVEEGARGSLGKGRFSEFLKDAFTPNKGLFDALRAPFSAALSTPIGAAMVTVAGTAALAFVGAFTAAIATAGLGAVFLGLGAAALIGTEKFQSAATRLGDTLKSVGKNAAQPLLDPLVKAMASLEGAAKRIEPLLTNIFAKLAPAIHPITDGIAGFVEAFLKVLNKDPATLEGMRDSLIAIGENLPKLGTALGQFFALLASNENNTRNIGILFDLAAKSIVNLALAFYGLSKLLDGIIIAWHAVEDAVSSAVEWITGTAIPAITGAASAVGNFFSSIPGVISSAWSAVVGFFSGIISSITGFVSSVASSVIGFFTALPGRIMSALTSLPGMIASFFSSAISTVAYAVGFGLGTIVSFFAQLPGRIVGALKALAGLVSGVFTSTLNSARNIVSSGIASVIAFFARLPGRVRSAISSVVSVVSSIFSSARSAAQSQSSALVSGAINVIKSLPGRIRSALSTVRSAVTGAFSGAGSWLVSAGRNIINGVKNGIASAIGGAVAAARSAASRIVAGFKSALQIGSPSRLMNLEVGRMIPAGAAEGIRDNAGVVDKAIRDMISSATTPDIGFTMPVGSARGSDGATLSGAPIHVTIQAGAIVVQGQGREAGMEAAEAVLERLGQATLAQ